MIPLVVLASGPGCGIGPRNFRAIVHPAPIVRARAAGLGAELPEHVVVPSLIARLDDPDCVVRLAASEELRRRTGQDFGYLPWGNADERRLAIGRWHAWWGQRQVALARMRQNP